MSTMIRQQINVMLQTRDAVEVVGEETNVCISAYYESSSTCHDSKLDLSNLSILCSR